MNKFLPKKQHNRVVRNNLEKMVGTSYGQMHRFLNDLKPNDYNNYSLEVSFLYDTETGDIPWLGRKGEEQYMFVRLSTIDKGKFILSWNHEKYHIDDIELGKVNATAEEILIQSMVAYNQGSGS